MVTHIKGITLPSKPVNRKLFLAGLSRPEDVDSRTLHPVVRKALQLKHKDVNGDYLPAAMVFIAIATHLVTSGNRVNGPTSLLNLKQIGCLKLTI